MNTQEYGMKPHIYRWRGMWYCIRDDYDVWHSAIAGQLFVGMDSPTEAYRLAKEYWKW